MKSARALQTHRSRRHRTGLTQRINRERLHAPVMLSVFNEGNALSGPVGSIRKERRVEYVTEIPVQLSARAPEELSVLEVGCGNGIFTRPLSEKFAHLTAIDISDVLLAEVRRTLPTVSALNADIHQTQFKDSQFDAVVGVSVLHHLDWDLALKEIHRILKPGGWIRFCEPNLMNPQIFLQKNWGWLKKKMGDSPDEYAFTAGQIRRSLTECGFRDITAQPFEFLHPGIPASWIRSVLALERILEATPLGVFGGSLKIEAFKI